MLGNDLDCKPHPQGREGIGVRHHVHSAENLNNFATGGVACPTALNLIEDCNSPPPEVSMNSWGVELVDKLCALV